MHTTSRLFHPTRGAAVDEFLAAIPRFTTNEPPAGDPVFARLTDDDFPFEDDAA